MTKIMPFSENNILFYWTAPKWSAFCFGAGYGSRTRLHGLGNIKAGFTLDLLNLKKYSICNSFSVFSNQ